VKKIVSVVCLCLSFETYLKNPIRLTIMHVHKLRSYIFLIIPVIFIDALPLLFTIFHYFWGVFFFTFNRFATIFCYFQQFVVDFLLLTDFPLLFAIFHYFCVCSFSTFNRFPAIICYFPLFLFVCWFSTFNRFLAILSYFPLYFFDFPFLPDMPLFIADLPQFFADFPHS